MRKVLDFFKSHKNAVTVCTLIILCFSLIIPFLIATRYALPLADDFLFVMKGQCADTNYFSNAIKVTVSHYFGWQGTYSSTFLWAFFSFMLAYGGIHGVQTGLVLFILCFFVSLYFLSYAIAVLFSSNKLITSIIFYLFLSVQLLLYSNVSEVFYWFCGATAYLLPICSFFLCVGFCLLNFSCRKRIYIILAGIFSFIAAGGPLHTTALNFVALFGIFLLSLTKEDKKYKRDYLLVCIIALSGSIINVVAPGNFIRNTYFSDSSPLSVMAILNAAKNSMEVFKGVVTDSTNNGHFYIFVILALYIFYDLLKEVDYKFSNPVLATIYLLFSNIIVIFPVTLGYNGTGYPSRVKFVYQLSYTFFSSITIIYWLGWMIKRNKIATCNKFLLISLVGLMLMVNLYTDSSNVISCTPIRLVKNLIDGDLKNYYNYNYGKLVEIEESIEDDVVLIVTKQDNKDTYRDVFSKANEWSYPAIARFYGKKSLTVIMEED